MVLISAISGFIVFFEMKKYISKKIVLSMVIISLLMTLLMGCGKRDVAIDTYKVNMETYFSSVATLNERMNNIDVSSVSTKEELDAECSKLLGYLDQLDTITTQMADLEVPEQFQLVESLADDAAYNMTEAVKLYHQLYEAEEYNEDIATAAYDYYERANLRIQYVRSILEGDIPEDLNIEYYDEESGEGE